MIQPSQCPVCQSQDGFTCTVEPYGSRDAKLFRCEVCGVFAMSRSALEDHNDLRSAPLNRVKRAALSHQIRLSQSQNREPRMLTSSDFQRDRLNALVLPSPPQQAINAIRIIGDFVSENGEPLAQMTPDFASTVGAPSREAAFELLEELKAYGQITALSQRLLSDFVMQDMNLSLQGWDRYELEKRGEIAGNYGFIALKFGDPVLDPFLANHVKPAVKNLGYDLFDMRDVSRAGVIDNLLRMQIRDSAFVLVDLTHENSGAYWEAGYAEGIGKPVLYLCERSKFDEKKTHFDTNHCTTVLWSIDAPEKFNDELIATLRRSLL